MWRASLLAAGVSAALSCGESTVGPSTSELHSNSSLHAEATDPAGDALADAHVPVSPDLLHATADVAGGNITWVVQLRSGTLDRQTTRVSIVLDTDQNASTGIQEWDGFGADYAIDFNISAAQATVVKADSAGCAAQASCFNPVGSVSLVAAESLQVTVPLSLLGGDDGRMNFWVASYVLASQGPSSPLDAMPDNPGQSPGRIE